MSEEAKPEVLPGDLISEPGVYMSRSNCAVEVRGYDYGCWKADWEDGVRWYHSSGVRAGMKVPNDPYQLVRWVGPLLEDIPTTSEQIAEIEGQADYTPPEGWRVLQVGEVLEDEDWLIDPRSGNGQPTLTVGRKVDHQIYIRRIEPEPEPTITPDDVAAEALAGVWDQAKATQEIAELQKAVNGTGAVNDSLRLQLEAVKAETTKRLQQVEELRSEVSYVQGLLGEESRRVVELETLVKDLRTVNAATEPEPEPQPVHLQAMVDAQTETISGLHSEIHVLNTEIGGLQAQLEAVKAELDQASRDRYALQIELIAREQVPEAVSDRFDQGFEQGAARAVETIAEWLEPLRKLIDAADNFAETNLASNLASDTIQALPHIMRSLTGLADTED